MQIVLARREEGRTRRHGLRAVCRRTDYCTPAVVSTLDRLHAISAQHLCARTLRKA